MTYDIAILGAGPAGLSAAARAVQRGLTHIVLESAQQHANTIQQYQQRKHVMAEPSLLPLRSDIGFSAGRREQVLADWQLDIDRTRVNIRFGAEATRISGVSGSFVIELHGDESISARHVILAMGVQGNPRRLGIPGDDHPCIQTTLSNPDEHRAETILVVGAGDSALENALALAGANRVVLVNRGSGFPRAKEGNARRMHKAIDAKAITGHYDSAIIRITDAPDNGRRRCRARLRSGGGETEYLCDRIITRLGAVAPRKFIEAIGVRYASDAADALPELSVHYESSVPGLYVIGALAGFPLIKQALNQGYEVIERLSGRHVDPADQGLLDTRLRAVPFADDVEAKLEEIRARIRLFQTINPLALRELVVASVVRTPEPGSEIFLRGSYLSTAFNVLQGEVLLVSPESAPVTVREGQMLGSGSLLSGRPSEATAIAGEDCVLLETPHRMIRRLMLVEQPAREFVDRVYILRALQRTITPRASVMALHHLAEGARIVRVDAGAELFAEGAAVDRVYLIRKGSVTLSQHSSGGELVVAHSAAGNHVDPISSLAQGATRTVTARATVATEILSLDMEIFNRELAGDVTLQRQLRSQRAAVLEQIAHLRSRPHASDIVSFLMSHGVGEATNMLVIDESLCIGCDQCETACASTHQGIARLKRRAGPTLNGLHLPLACRHCEHPHCMSDCPADAIHRQPGGEVIIDDSCIGCGNCEENCPYGAIEMAQIAPARSIADRLLRRPAPEAAKLALKCDQCSGAPAGPACVNACPTGAAIRIGADAIISLAEQRARKKSAA